MQTQPGMNYLTQTRAVPGFREISSMTSRKVYWIIAVCSQALSWPPSSCVQDFGDIQWIIRIPRFSSSCPNHFPISLGPSPSSPSPPTVENTKKKIKPFCASSKSHWNHPGGIILETRKWFNERRSESRKYPECCTSAMSLPCEYKAKNKSRLLPGMGPS